MFKTIRPIYNKLFTILNDEFSLDENSDGGIFKTFQAGLFFRDENVLASHLFPWAFLEFGNIGDVQRYRSPEVYKYELNYPLVLMTFADMGDQDRLVFNDNKEEGGYNVNPGIGDLVEKVGGFLWDQYHSNRLDLFDVRSIKDKYGIENWTYSGVGTPTVPHVQTMMIHPYFRAVQIDITFEVVERQGLI